MHFLFFLTALSFLTLSANLFPSITAYPFRDLSRYAGISRKDGRLRKYGGAAVADLNGDGWPDMICGHHDSISFQVYFNNGNGTFTLNKFKQFSDTHGLNPFRPYPRFRGMYFIHSQGGSRGTRPNSPRLLKVVGTKITDVTGLHNDFLTTYRRGRSAIILSMRPNNKGRWKKSSTPDVLLLNRKDEFYNHHRAFQINSRGILRQRILLPSTLRNVWSNYGGVTDIDGDGKMEVVLTETLNIWKLTGSFKFEDITSDVLPKDAKLNYFGVLSFAELDYDNDGHFDLILIRSNGGHHWWVRRQPLHDNLLRNVDGKRYEDVTEAAKLPIDDIPPSSHGVTVGDFDNDGYIDIFICRFESDPPYILLRNLGNGTFERMPYGFSRKKKINGDMATAVDYDRDGRIDLIVSEGNWGGGSEDPLSRGNYRVMRNVWQTGNGYLLVRVKNAPGFTVTSLHAVVAVSLPNGMKMYRRVGSPGTMVSNSYIELVHFGLGKQTYAVSVSVKWTDGSFRQETNVAANSTLTIGVDV